MKDTLANNFSLQVAKCVFRKYGISGTVETHDALCVLPLNILNEKICIFLWFWLVAMLIFTSLSFAFHLALLCSAQLRAGLLRFKTQNLIGADLAGYITKNVRYRDSLLIPPFITSDCQDLIHLAF